MVAIPVGIIDPTGETARFLGICIAILAGVALLATLAAKIKFLSVRLRSELVLLMISLFVSAVLGELGLRFFYYDGFPNPRAGYNLHYRFDDELGWFPIPNSHAEGVGAYKVSLAHNSRGFRDPEHELNDEPRIIFSGDSFVWGYDVEVADRFTEKFQAMHPDWRAYNFGVSGYATDQEFLLLQRHFDEYRPRLVFLMFCTQNDDDGNRFNFTGMYFKPYYTVEGDKLILNGIPVPRSERVFCAEHPILSRSYLVRLAVRAYKNLTHPPATWYDPPTYAILQHLRDYVVGKGARLVVGLTDTEPELEKYLERSNIPYLNLSTALQFRTDDHWNAEGHTVVAEKISEFLEAGGYLRSEKSGN